jgi:muconolactone delta-isomerase
MRSVAESSPDTTARRRFTVRFLVESSFAQAPTSELFALIPAEASRGAELDAQGVRERLYIAADQSRSWQVFRAESAVALQSVLQSFPLHPYLSHTVTALAGE